VTVYEQLRDSKLESPDAVRLTKEITGVDLEVNDSLDAYIDHQSQICLPYAFDDTPIHREFYRQFESTLLRDDVVILGGNDNDGEHSERERAKKEIMAFSRLCECQSLYSHYRCRWDATKEFFTLFDDVQGTKLRMTIHDGKDKITKASVPELVDMKITDNCHRGCAYCYQDSSPSGRHADIEDIAHIISDLGKLDVFEVAIGGGEPTSHPYFASILAMCRDNHIVPNFSTRNLMWLNGPHAEIILNNIGRFAYSVETSAEVRLLKEKVAELKCWGKAAVQYVIGSGEGIVAIVKEASGSTRYRYRKSDPSLIPVTLLWPKAVGRGANHPFKSDDMLKAMRNLKAWHKKFKGEEWPKHYYEIGADTMAMAQHSPKVLARYGITPDLYETTEGKFSMYIDAVTNKIGPSSFAPDKMVPVVNWNYAHTIRQEFSKW
jgi:hypothetical protein